MFIFRPVLHSTFLFLVALAAFSSTAQPQIENIPANATLYVGWRGAENLGPAYEGSNLQGMLDEIGLLEAIPEWMALINQLNEDGEIEAEEAQMLGMAAAGLSSTWTHGGAMYIVPPAEQGPPIPQACILWNKGEGQEQLAELLQTITAILAEEMPVFTGSLDGTLYLSLGFDPADADGEIAALSTSADFKAAIKHIQDDAALIVYANAKDWVTQIDQIAEIIRQQARDFGETDPFAELWPTIKDASGLDGVQSLAISAGLENKNWHTRLFLGVPAPRRGVFSLFDQETIRPENLQHIPQTATYVQALSMQPSRVLDMTTEFANKVDPNMIAAFDQAMEQANENVGFDLERDLIRGMGSVWSIYIDPMIAGNGFASIVLTNELENAQAVERALIKLSQKANDAFIQDDDVKIRWLSEKIGKSTITHLGIPFIAPAWTIHNDRLYVALYPQALEMAIEQSGKRADSILANKAFQGAMARFLKAPAGNKSNAFETMKPVISFSFTDLPATTAEGYSSMMMLTQALAGASEMLTGEPSSLRLPPVSKLIRHIQEAGAIIHVDDDGLHIHSIEPFPGATLIHSIKNITGSASLSAPMLVGTALPALGAARNTARTMQTMAQARQVTFANVAYSIDNKGNYAEDIAQLEEYFVDPEFLISPRSTRGIAFPVNFFNLPDAKRAELIRKNSSFVLIPLGNERQVRFGHRTVMLFERPDDAGERDIAVGMADGSTVRMPEVELEQLLREQTGQSIRQLIRRQENFGE